MTTKERPTNADQILKAYAAKVQASFTTERVPVWFGHVSTEWAKANPDEWQANCAADAEKNVALGRDTWERLAKVAQVEVVC